MSSTLQFWTQSADASCKYRLLVLPTHVSFLTNSGACEVSSTSVMSNLSSLLACKNHIVPSNTHNDA